MKALLASVALVSLMVGCGGKYVDDRRSFGWAFGAKCPTNIQVVHSLWLQSPHFTDEHRFYFQLAVEPGTALPGWLRQEPTIVECKDGLKGIPMTHGLPEYDVPTWFAPAVSTNYQVWYSTNVFTPFVVAQQRQRGQIFVYGSCGM